LLTRAAHGNMLAINEVHRAETPLRLDCGLFE